MSFFILKKPLQKYLGVKGYYVCIILSNGAEKAVCVYAYKHIYIWRWGGMIKWQKRSTFEVPE